MASRGQRKIIKPAAQLEHWRLAQKRVKGQPIFYDELKICRINAVLTPTAKKHLDAIASANQLSISELLERWLRGIEGLILP